MNCLKIAVAMWLFSLSFAIVLPSSIFVEKATGSPILVLVFTLIAAFALMKSSFDYIADTICEYSTENIKVGAVAILVGNLVLQVITRIS